MHVIFCDFERILKGFGKCHLLFLKLQTCISKKQCHSAIIPKAEGQGPLTPRPLWALPDH